MGRHRGRPSLEMNKSTVARVSLHIGLPRNIGRLGDPALPVRLARTAGSDAALSFAYLCVRTIMTFWRWPVEFPLLTSQFGLKLPNHRRHDGGDQPGEHGHAAANGKVMLEAIPTGTHDQHGSLMGDGRAERR